VRIVALTRSLIGTPSKSIIAPVMRFRLSLERTVKGVLALNETP
jgi:hypothetical protein